MGWIADIFKEIPLSVNLQAKLDALEDKFAVLELRNKELESENKNLRQEIQRRDDIIQKEKSHDNLLEDVKVNILIFLAKYDKPNTEQIARSLNVNGQIIKFHLTELKSTNMVNDLLAMNSPTRWTLAHAGRKYLIENKLIS